MANIILGCTIVFASVVTISWCITELVYKWTGAEKYTRDPYLEKKGVSRHEQS